MGIFGVLLTFLRSLLLDRAGLVFENRALRHQLLVPTGRHVQQLIVFSPVSLEGQESVWVSNPAARVLVRSMTQEVAQQNLCILRAHGWEFITEKAQAVGSLTGDVTSATITRTEFSAGTRSWPYAIWEMLRQRGRQC